MKKIKVVILFGESCAGKDTILDYCLKHMKDAKPMISCTTRQPRDGEVDGINYHFISNVEFAEKVLNHTIVEATSWCGEFYGTPIETLKEDKINIGVLDTVGVEAMLADSRLDVLPVYVAASPKTRLLRYLKRETNPDCEKMCKRFLEDLEKFSDISFEYQTFLNDDLIAGPTDFNEIVEIISIFAQSV